MQLKKYARDMRRNSTNAEHLLWQQLRRKQIEGYRFRVQVVIEPYIVDFVCFEVKLIVEVDGGQHQLQATEDSARDEYLMRHGYTVLRFWNNEVHSNMHGVIETIRQNLITPP